MGTRRPASVLVIDDDGPLRALVRTILEAGGYRVHEAGDGAEGVDLYRQGRHLAALP